MAETFNLAVIDSAFLPLEFATIIARANAGGFTVLRYPDNASFHAATSDHARIDALFCMGGTICSAALLETMPRLRALLSAVTGIEGFDLQAATRLGVIIGNGQTELNYVGMAESTILLILAAFYDFNHTQQLLRQNGARPSPLRARILRGRRIGFVGFGRIAQEVAKRLADWGLEMVCYTHRPMPEIAALGVTRLSLESLLRTADIVSLHCSLNPQTHHIIGAAQLAMMKPDGVLINTARGALVDEAALATALAEHRIAGAALDTFEIEPLPAVSPLRELENAILTPHMIGHTAECNASLMETAWQSISNVARGALPVFVKNPGVLPTWQTRFQTA